MIGDGTAWVAIDPGLATGIIARHGDDLLAWDVVIHPTARPKPGEVITAELIGWVLTSVRMLHGAAEATGADVRVVIEGLNRPTGRKGGALAFIRPGDLLAPAIILGALRATYPTALVVPPKRHGRRVLSSYPAELVTPGEARHGLDREAPQSAVIRHARSAWDVAESAARVAALTRR